MDFEVPPELADIAQRVREFVDSEVVPLEGTIDFAVQDVEALQPMRARARELGLYGPQLPAEYGGLGLNTTGMCLVFEQAGRSPLGALALNCSAPDEGNMHTLLIAGRPDQLEKYLVPLAAGETRSCFVMTEPHPGAGADASMLAATAVRDGDGWVVNGSKWFATGADGAAFGIVCAITNPEVPPQRGGASLFLVDAGTPGFEVKKRTPVMGSEGPGGHCEIELSDLRVADDAMLGPEGDGFKLMQRRLGPARLTHCMRWIGVAQRCLEIAVDRAVRRQAFGKPLADHQAIQWMVADSEIDLHAARLMTLHAAWKLDQGDEARQETSICKVFVAEAINRVIDRAVQILGGLGISEYTPVAEFFREARAFRIYDGPSEVHRMVVARRIFREAKARAESAGDEVAG